MLHYFIKMDSKLIEVFKKGKYYNPASDHHLSKDDDSGTVINVICDRCQVNNLKICIGYKDYDLCLKCVGAINDLHEEKKTERVAPVNISTRKMMGQGMFRRRKSKSKSK